MVDLRDVSLTYQNHTVESAGFADVTPSNEIVSSGGQLRHLNLNLRPGELTLVTGPSGCGKTSLLRLINGLIPRYYPGNVTGEILLAGSDRRSAELYDLAPLVGTVFQNPRSQFFNVDTTSELAFSCENRCLDVTEIRARLNATIRQLQLEHLVDRNIFRLSGGEKQQIACGTVDVARPPLILLDEPSANLDYPAMLRLREIVRIWQAEGKTILVAEHRLAYLWDLLDRLIVLKDGVITHDFQNRAHLSLTNEDLQKLGLRTKDLTDPKDLNLPMVQSDDTPVRFQNFCFTYKKSLFGAPKETAGTYALSDFTFAENKITALTGANGSGKSTLLRCLCGLEKRAKGTLLYKGKTYTTKQRKDLCFLVMQESAHQLFTESVLAEVLLSLPANGASDAARRKKARAILKKVNLENLDEKHPMTLSGGQMQRLAVAAALASEREILLFDEPTSGLDYRNMAETARLLKELSLAGKTVIVATHDSELIHAACDRAVDLENLFKQQAKAQSLHQ